jgi:uncharacterized protein YegP (UPF0339 family)
MPDLEVYQRTDHRWAWRLRASNGAIVATDGGQGYENRADAARMADAVTSDLYADSTCHIRLDRIREHLTWWERPDRPHADGAALAIAIRAIIDPPTTASAGPAQTTD